MWDFAGYSDYYSSHQVKATGNVLEFHVTVVFRQVSYDVCL